MATELIDWMLRATLASTAALLVALALRGIVRRRFGAGAAYALWLLVPAALLAVSLPLPVPRATAFVVEAAAEPAADPMPSVRVGVATVLQPVTELTAGGNAYSRPMLAWAWAAGAVAMLLWLFWQQRRFMAGLGVLSRREEGVFVAAVDSASPAAVGLLRARIVLPADFAQRYSEDEAALIIAHEREHVRRGDIRINGCVAALRCLFWFNPLLHWAVARFRFDQELACDAAVLAQHPRSRRAYADAMLKTQLAVLGLPVGCHWQSSQSLKERILMLKRPLPGRTRARIGAIVVCCTIAATGFAAWATQPASILAPERRGYLDEDGVAFAHVRTPEGTSTALEMSGPSMGSDEQPGTTRVVLSRRMDLRIASIDATGSWEVLLRGAGRVDRPEAEWKFLRQGSVVAQGRQAIPESGRTVLAIVVDPMPVFPQIELSRLPTDRVVEYPDKDARSPALTRESDGSWLDNDWMVSYGQSHAVNGGRAVLLAHIGADGKVHRVEIEKADPPGSLSQEEATRMLSRRVYVPPRVDGKPVPSRMRVPVNYSRDIPERRQPVVAVGSSAPRVDTPAPPYPADALAKKIRGGVTLHLLVGIDGMVKDVRVIGASPQGVFEEVAVEAAKKWTLQPPMQDGKPVQGWLEVPIVFEPRRVPNQG